MNTTVLASATVGNPVANMAIFGVFVLVTLFVVIRASKRNATADEFFTGGRAFSGPQNGIAIAGDYLSAASFLGIAGAIAVYGYDGFLYSIGFLVAWLVALLLVAELLRNEHPQIVAAILVHLEYDQAADVLKNLSDRQRNEVMLRVATMEGAIDILRSTGGGRVVPGVLLIGALLALWLSRRIHRLAAGTAALIQGRYQVQIQARGQDELARLDATKERAREAGAVRMAGSIGVTVLGGAMRLQEMQLKLAEHVDVTDPQTIAGLQAHRPAPQGTIP